MIALILALFTAALGFAMYGYFQYQAKALEEEQKFEWLRHRELVVLTIQVPKNNDKSPLAAEQVFASLHGIFQKGALLQEELSFEIVAIPGAVRFYVVVPKQLRDFVEGQIYAQYPNIEVRQVDDYIGALDRSSLCVIGAELGLDKPDVYPIKQYQSFDVDPLAGITSVLANLKEQEQTWIQMIIRPEDEGWQQRGIDLVAAIKAGKPAKPNSPHPVIRLITFGFHFVGSLVRFLTGQATNAPAAADDKAAKELSSPVQEALQGVEEKITKLGYATKLRLTAIASSEEAARANLTATASAFKQFNTNNLNNLVLGPVKANDEEYFGYLWSRLFLDSGHVFNITELASLFHFPSISAETPNIVWAGAKKSEPPANLPLVNEYDPADITILGVTDFRQRIEKFGIKIKDRLRHMYVIGKSGTGKSTLLENMILDDIRENRGVIVVDPHGELIDHIIDEIPDHRMQDTILMDPADRNFPIGLNLLEAVDDDLKGIVASGFVGILEKIFGNSWGPRMEHILRNCVLALLDTPGQTMLGIPKILVEKKYRMEIIKNVKDPVVRDFWESEFEAWDPKFRTEAVAPIQNKVGQFLSTPTIRNIVGQAKSTINIREVMDEEKILLINLSKGKIGEDNSALLGAMIITKVQLAAMSRANLEAAERKNTFLYVDEFQNFATESFATILSEARKYALSLTMANQYIAQMEEVVREAVFGNVGSLVSFRVGAGDAPFLAKEMAPIFDEQDMVNLDIHHIYTKMSVDGKSAQAFSATTLPPIYNHTGHAAEIRRLTQTNYGVEREAVEAEIAKWNEDTRPKLVIHPGQERFLNQQNRPAGQGSAPQTGNVGSGHFAQQVTAAPAAQPAILTVKPMAANAISDAKMTVVTPMAAKPIEQLSPITPAQPMPVVSEPVAPVAEQLLPPPEAEIQPTLPAPVAALPVPELPSAGEAAELALPVPDQAVGEPHYSVESEQPAGRPWPKNVINGLHYREVAKRGGEKWYFGVPYYLPDGRQAGDFSVPDKASVQPPPPIAQHQPTGRTGESSRSDGRPAPARATAQTSLPARFAQPTARPSERPASPTGSRRSVTSAEKNDALRQAILKIRQQQAVQPAASDAPTVPTPVPYTPAPSPASSGIGHSTDFAAIPENQPIEL